jgi:hypothetical protein
MTPREVLSFFIGAGTTIAGTLGLFVILNLARDTNSGVHLYTIEAGWLVYGLYKIAHGFVGLNRDKDTASASKEIAFGIGAVLTVPVLLFIGLH